MTDVFASLFAENAPAQTDDFPNMDKLTEPGTKHASPSRVQSPQGAGRPTTMSEDRSVDPKGVKLPERVDAESLQTASRVADDDKDLDDRASLISSENNVSTIRVDKSGGSEGNENNGLRFITPLNRSAFAGLPNGSLQPTFKGGQLQHALSWQRTVKALPYSSPDASLSDTGLAIFSTIPRMAPRKPSQLSEASKNGLPSSTITHIMDNTLPSGNLTPGKKKKDKTRKGKDSTKDKSESKKAAEEGTKPEEVIAYPKAQTEQQSSTSFDNPVFVGLHGNSSSADPDDATDDEASNQGRNNNKKVSWNETVVYSSETSTDIVIAGLHDEESETDPPTDVQVVASPSPNGELPTGSPSGPPGPQGNSRPHRKYAHKPRGAGGGGGGGLSNEHKCSLCVAVVLVSLALIGLVILGTLYGVRFAPSPGDNAETIRTVLDLQSPEMYDLFVRAYHSSSPTPGEAVYYLVESADFMPWQKPSANCRFVHLLGKPLKVYSIGEQGVLQTFVLGDPLTLKEASFTLTMDGRSWWAVVALDGSGHSLITVFCDYDTNWRQGRSEVLVARYPLIAERINEFARPAS